MKKRLLATLLASLLLAANVLVPLCGGVATRAMASDTVSGGDIPYQESVSQNDFLVSDDSVSQGDVLPDEGGGDEEGPESAGQDDTDNYAHNYIDEHAVRIQNTEADSMVMPDKYNTGAKGSLQKVGLADTVNGIVFLAGSNSTYNVLDFVLKNQDVKGVITFSDLDFSDYPVTVYREDAVERKIKLVFNNCKFSSMRTGRGEYNISYEYNNCTFNSFSGSNATFNYCVFGGHYNDGMVPFRNIAVNNCYFRDFASVPFEEEGELHSDGIQIYGYENVDAENIIYNNCRFEVPPITNEFSNAYVNACIMLQMEYSNAKGIRFSNCTVNGGGYSIYARGAYDKCTLENISFEHIKIGCANKYGAVYPSMSPGVSLSDFTETDALYIGSVWKENGATHLSVTNDTNQERTLVVYTDKARYEYSIPACPRGGQLTSSTTFDALPFDIDIRIEEDCGYLLCFDTTMRGNAKQIRFVNWQSEEVLLNSQVANALYTQQPEVIASGACGKEVSYTLTNTGVLTLSGKGATYSYHSGNRAPWTDYAHYIKTIVVEEGIESLRNQLFSGCSGVTSVVLPESLINIGGRTFAQCFCLLEISFPGSIQTIGEAAFSAVPLQRATYRGTDWNRVQLGKQNERVNGLILGTGIVEEEPEIAPPVVTPPEIPETVVPDIIISQGTSTQEKPLTNQEPAKPQVQAPTQEPAKPQEPVEEQKIAEPQKNVTNREQTKPKAPAKLQEIAEHQEKTELSDTTETQIVLAQKPEVKEEPIVETFVVDEDIPETQTEDKTVQMDEEQVARTSSESVSVAEEKVSVVVIFLSALVISAGGLATVGVIKILK